MNRYYFIWVKTQKDQQNNKLTNWKGIKYFNYLFILPFQHFIPYMYILRPMSWTVKNKKKQKNKILFFIYKPQQLKGALQFPLQLPENEAIQPENSSTIVYATNKQYWWSKKRIKEWWNALMRQFAERLRDSGMKNVSSTWQ